MSTDRADGTALAWRHPVLAIGMILLGILLPRRRRDAARAVV